MDFTDEGADTFEEITRDVAQRGRLLYNTVGGGQGDHRNFLQHFAIVLDREIKSWPTIDFDEYPGGISGSNGAQISGLADVGEAKDLALVLQTGALPVEFRTLDQTAISATLGKDSLEQAKIAALVGLLAVAVFLLVFYRFLGVVAVVGLGVYAAILYAAILLFNVTLTLPGIAGLVLTLGVAADANIVIFERIKEEVRAGRSIRAAIQTGYTKGFATIVDANVVTMITALVLFAVATASVRGFALMLLVGTAISMLTAVVATRAFLAVLAGLKVLDSPRVMGAAGGGIPRWLKADYIGRRNTWFAISATVLLLSVGAIAIKGLNLGIDFRGGTQISFTTPQPVPLEDVRAQAAKIGQGSAQIQGRGPGDRPVRRELPSFAITSEALSTAEVASLQSNLNTAVNAEPGEVKNVSASFGQQIARGAVLAIIVSLLLIVLYISVRFQWKFAVPVLVALGHDVLITIGIYALLGREVTTATVAAVLTVLGYSIYDTIIIFDRIRENMPADEAGVLPRDRERVAVGDDSPLARDDVHHARADRLALALRRRHAEGLRLRAPRRDRGRRLLVHLHRCPAPRDLQGARAGVRAAARRRGRCRRVCRRHPARAARAGARRARTRPPRSHPSRPRLPSSRTRPSRPRRPRGANGAASGAAVGRTAGRGTADAGAVRRAPWQRGSLRPRSGRLQGCAPPQAGVRLKSDASGFRLLPNPAWRARSRLRP